MWSSHGEACDYIAQPLGRSSKLKVGLPVGTRAGETGAVGMAVGTGAMGTGSWNRWLEQEP
jgi:hypothetical protein